MLVVCASCKSKGLRGRPSGDIRCGCTHVSGELMAEQGSTCSLASPSRHPCTHNPPINFKRSKNTKGLIGGAIQTGHAAEHGHMLQNKQRRPCGRRIAMLQRRARWQFTYHDRMRCRAAGRSPTAPPPPSLFPPFPGPHICGGLSIAMAPAALCSAASSSGPSTQRHSTHVSMDVPAAHLCTDAGALLRMLQAQQATNGSRCTVAGHRRSAQSVKQCRRHWAHPCWQAGCTFPAGQRLG